MPARTYGIAQNSLKNSIRKWWVLSTLLIVYKVILDVVLLRVYYTVYSYMTHANYEPVPAKIVISYGMLFIFLLFISQYFRKENIYSVILTIIYTICIIPMLSVYAFVSYVTIDEIIYPTIFWLIFLALELRYEKQGGTKNHVFRIPSIKQASIGVLGLCSLFALICWAWAGFPLLFSMSDSLAQRLELRANSMPRLLSYVFVILGGTVFPYLFARFLNEKKIINCLISVFWGFALYSINGMKTWLFLYLIAVAIYLGCEFLNNNYYRLSCALVLVFILLSLVSVLAYVRFGQVVFLSQVGRILCIPNGIGFRSITFFKENELLFLRESILRHLFDSPYPGGSDFYIDYGVNSTINSARSNNGLWGDAFRNFGLIGMFVYPVVITYILDIVRKNFDNYEPRFAVFVIFALIWNSVNVSFFTWLLTGGVIVILVINRFFYSEDHNRLIKNKVYEVR